MKQKRCLDDSHRGCGGKSSSPLLLIITLLFSELSAESRDTLPVQSSSASVSSSSMGERDDEVVLSAGNSLRRHCAGHLPVTWLSPALAESLTLTTRMQVTNSASNDSYESILEVKNVEYLDTGSYQCVYQRNHSDVAASVYLYVFDGKNLFISKDVLEHDQWVVRNREAVLPWCRTALPNISVTFVNVRRSAKSLKGLYSTNPRIGVVIKNGTTVFHGAFYCKAEYANVTKNVRTRLSFRESTKRRPNVSLTSKHKDNKTLTTDTVQFDCNGDVYLDAVLLNPNDVWTYPMKGLETGDRIKELPGNRTDQGQLVQYKLVVQNFSLADSGLYRCSLTDHDFKTGNSELYMIAYESPFLNLSAESAIVEIQENVDRLILSVKVDAYPRPQLSWHRNNQALKEVNQTNKYGGLESSNLSIYNINPSDEGSYTLKASQELGNTVMFNITVIVNYRPVVTVTILNPVMTPQFYLRNSNFGLECHSTGCPEPVVNWEWQSCANTMCSAVDGNWRPLNYSKNNVSAREKFSRLIINAQQSGWFRCGAINKIGSDNKAIQFLVTDIPDGFGLKIDQSSAFEGANITASCLVNEFMHNLTDLYWMSNDSSLMNSTEIGEETRFLVNNFKYEFHSFSNLTFVNVKIEDSGLYWCVATDVNGETHLEMWNLTVTAAEEGVVKPMAFYLDAVKGVSIVFVMIVVSLFIIIIMLSRRSRNKFSAVHLEELLRSSTNSNYNPNLSVDEQTEMIPYDPQWEFSKDQLKLDIVIGKGAFGTVYRAKAFGLNVCEPVTTVAVKTVKDCGKMEQLKALVSELKVLKHLGQHVNILNALGAVTQDIRKGILYVIMEFCHFGCLRDYLIKQRCHFIGYDNSSFSSGMLLTKADILSNDEIAYLKGADSFNNDKMMDGKLEQPVTQKELICYAFQIARGLEYLHSKKYIHRDLAARNILLAEGNVIKICDFGLAKDCYKYNQYHKKSNTPVPIKWMAIESLTHNLYTTRSDIWSYGVVLWELFTMGGNPYPTLKIDKTFIELLDAGYRLERPFLADDLVYKTMLCCWDSESASRPSASHLVETFGGLLEATVKQHYIDLRTVDYLRMNSKSGCLESLVNLNGEEENLARRKSALLTRQKLSSVESGFASLTKAGDVDHFEYLPPSVVDSSDGGLAWSHEVFDCGKTPSSSDPAYENAALVLMEENCNSLGGASYQNFPEQESSVSHPLSIDFCSGISDADTVFDEPDSYSPYPSNSISVSFLTASI